MTDGGGDTGKADPGTGEELVGAATLAVKKGPIWPGGVVEVALELSGEHLTIEIPPRELNGQQRSAVKRLLGEQGLDELRAGRARRLEILIREARFAFPDSPGGRASILVQLEGKPKLSINFLDWSAVEEIAHRGRPGQILKRTGGVLGKRGDARAAREGWRAALQRRGASG